MSNETSQQLIKIHMERPGEKKTESPERVSLAGTKHSRTGFLSGDDKAETTEILIKIKKISCFSWSRR
jgi:hypothetical protein